MHKAENLNAFLGDNGLFQTPARDRELKVVQPVSRASEPTGYGDLQLLKCTINMGQWIKRSDERKLPTDAIYLTKAHLGWRICLSNVGL